MRPISPERSRKANSIMGDHVGVANLIKDLQNAKNEARSERERAEKIRHDLLKQAEEFSYQTASYEGDLRNMKAEVKRMMGEVANKQDDIARLSVYKAMEGKHSDLCQTNARLFPIVVIVLLMHANTLKQPPQFLVLRGQTCSPKEDTQVSFLTVLKVKTCYTCPSSRQSVQLSGL